MAYEKTNWQTGDTVTAEKLNHVESGIAAAGQVMVVTIDPETSALQSTWQVIYDALKSGVFVYLNDYSEENETTFNAYNHIIAMAGLADGAYYVNVFDWSALVRFATDSATGYPVIDD